MGDRKKWIPAILAIIAFLVEIAFNLFGVTIYVGLGFTVALLIIQIVVLQRELIEIKTQVPNVVPVGFQLERPFHLLRGGRPEEIIERYYVMFRNNKPAGKTICDTKSVHAIVSFYDMDLYPLNNLSHEEPFWLKLSGPPWERSENFTVILKASSKPEGLCLVTRQQGGSDLFVFSDRSYITNFRTLEPFQDSLRIPLSQFYISIQLMAENLDMQPIWISVTNRGESELPLFEVIDQPVSTLQPETATAYNVRHGTPPTIRGKNHKPAMSEPPRSPRRHS